MSKATNDRQKRAAAFLLGIMVMASPLGGLHAAPLEDVSLQQQGDVVLATIKLTTQVHFLRAVPGANARTVEILYERVPSSDSKDIWVDREVRSSPETMLTPAFTVTTLDQAVQPKMVVEFAREVNFLVNVGADSRSFVITLKPEKRDSSIAADIPLPLLPTVLPPVPDATSAAPVVPPAEGGAPADNNKQAYALMLEGRDALSAKNYSVAMESFNKLLMLPPNQYSQDAQEWVGVARERGGQLAKAKVEYELYLKLYTTGPGVQWVKQRLAQLATPETAAKMGAATKVVRPRSFVQGGISSHYYFGQSNLETTYPSGTGTQTSIYSLKDQSSLISNVDATGRYVSETYDNRIVFRDTSTQNFLPGQASRNRINSAYFEIKDRALDYSARLGRQTAGGGGVMGRFDGVSAGYGAPQDFRVNGVAGQLVEFSSYAQPATQPIFYGISVDKGPFSVYLIDQSIEGVQDRRVLGAEFKYFEGSKTAFAMLDYDIYFKVLNAAMFTATLGIESTGTNLNIMADYRNSPSISTRNALNGATTVSVKDLLAIMAEAELQKLARDRTGRMAFSQLGVTQKLSSNWQLGGDVKLTKVSGLPASGIAPDPVTGYLGVQGYVAATPDSGLEKTLTAQIIGSKLYSDADITSVGSSYITSDYVIDGQSVFIYNRTAWDRDLSFDTSWNFYRQSYKDVGSMARNMPMLRVNYQMHQELSFDADVGMELTTTTGYQTTTNTRQFFSLGFRWDF